jgi:hypothetical protein
MNSHSPSAWRASEAAQNTNEGGAPARPVALRCKTTMGRTQATPPRRMGLATPPFSGCS